MAGNMKLLERRVENILNITSTYFDGYHAMYITNLKMDKRERGTNFSQSDKELLLNIVSDNFFKVIENKKTDGVTIKEKNEAWEAVAIHFNAATSNPHRSGIQLKNAYNNIKRKLKKDNADEKIQIYKTGGGVKPPSKITDCEIRMLELLKSQLDPINNKFDSSTNFIIQDAVPPADEEELQFCDVEYLLSPQPSNNAAPQNTEEIAAGPSRLENSPSPCIEEKKKSCKKVKKRTIRNIYDNISSYAASRKAKTININRKAEIELEILELKKQIYSEKLKQEKINTSIKELELENIKSGFKEN